MWVNVNYLVARGLMEQGGAAAAAAAHALMNRRVVYCWLTLLTRCFRTLLGRGCRHQHSTHCCWSFGVAAAPRPTVRTPPTHPPSPAQPLAPTPRCPAAPPLRRTVAEVGRWYSATGSVYEYYDATGRLSPVRLRRKGVGGVGGVRDYHWTAALTLRMMAELYAVGSGGQGAGAGEGLGGGGGGTGAAHGGGLSGLWSAWGGGGGRAGHQGEGGGAGALGETAMGGPHGLWPEERLQAAGAGAGVAAGGLQRGGGSSEAGRAAGGGGEGGAGADVLGT